MNLVKYRRKAPDVAKIILVNPLIPKDTYENKYKRNPHAIVWIDHTVIFTL